MSRRRRSKRKAPRRCPKSARSASNAPVGAPKAGAAPTGSGHPIDAFVAQGLHRAGLAPAPEADRATLLRRVTLDLTGLLPGPEEVAAFLGDTRTDAYERVVDRLLASPHYGEHLARSWLDAARYADTDGYAIDAAEPTPSGMKVG